MAEPDSGAPSPVAGGGPAGTGLGYAQVVLGAVLFGVNASVSKVVLTGGIEPARLAALRATGSAVGLVAILVVIGPGRLRVPLRSLPPLALLGGCGAALIQWL